MQKVVHMMVDFFTSLSDIVVFNLFLNTVLIVLNSCCRLRQFYV